MEQLWLRSLRQVSMYFVFWDVCLEFEGKFDYALVMAFSSDTIFSPFIGIISKSFGLLLNTIIKKKKLHKAQHSNIPEVFHVNY